MKRNLATQIKKEARKFFINAQGSHDWEHTERVLRLCLRIGKKERADLEILTLAALLHDIGRKEETNSRGKIDHAEKGAELAEIILKKYKLDPKKINQVTHCILSHRFRGRHLPKSKEARVLFDADKLDSIGAIGIGRAFLFAGEISAKLHNSKVPFEKMAPYGPEDTAYREFLDKLQKVKNRMKTHEGKRIAQERHRFMVAFFDRLTKEVDGIL